jgi:hypothetical protein
MALCDYLLWAAQRSVFRPGWSRPILDEAERNLVARGAPNAPRRMQRMREAFEDADPGKTAIGRQMKMVPGGWLLVELDDRAVDALPWRCPSRALSTRCGRLPPTADGPTLE